MSNYAVRLVRHDERDALLQLYQHLHADDKTASRDQIAVAWDSIQSQPGMTVHVIENSNQLVASCILCVIPNLTRGCRSYALIENVVTHADFRRLGYGSHVVRHALDTAWKEGCYKVMLLTGRNDTAEFYQACGFTADGKTGYLARPTH